MESSREHIVLADSDPLIGRSISHYEITERIGEGGMGIVYKARDRKLPRTVVLKFLSTLLSADRSALRRFEREAQAAASIQHVNVCSIYDFDYTESGRPYIVMAYVDGEALSERIRRGRLPVSEAVDYALQILRGLAVAHERGITHRDIKPANIYVTQEGTVKLLDFGLAYLVGASLLTKPDRILGTTAYMSPEQLSGRVVDHRTDIWSLGVVLYEMLAGFRPFEAEYHAALSYGIMHNEPAPIGAVRQDVPSFVERAMSRMLRKNPDDRYPDALGVAQDLDRGSGHRIETSDRKTSILVLPFTDLSPDGKSGYFSDGITEELISGLAEMRRLRVICRTSAWQAKASGKDIETLRRELEIDYLLDGSVRRMNDRVRITTQLIDTATQSALFTAKHDGTLDDIFAFQEAVAAKILDALRLRFTTEDRRRITSRGIDEAHAYDCYLRARDEISRYTIASVSRAIHLLKNGLQIVGENALLFGGMGYAHWTFANLGVDREKNLSEAEALADRVLSMVPDHPQGLRLHGLIAMLKGDQPGAIRKLSRAVRIDPRDTESIVFLTIMLGFVGKTAEARPLASEMLVIDPLNPISYGLRGWLDYLEGDFEGAFEAYGEMHAMDPEHPSYRYYYAQALAATNRLDEAFEVIDRLTAHAPDHPFAGMCLCFEHALRGDADAARRVVTPVLREACRADVGYAWFMADCFALMGDVDGAIEWLSRSVELGFINHPFLSRTDPFLGSIRGDARFGALMEDVESRWRELEIDYVLN